MTRDDQTGWMCMGCGKHFHAQPWGTCADCGGRFTRATPEKLACERCGDLDASRVLGPTEYNRLCADCIEWANDKTAATR